MMSLCRTSAGIIRGSGSPAVGSAGLGHVDRQADVFVTSHVSVKEAGSAFDSAAFDVTVGKFFAEDNGLDKLPVNSSRKARHATKLRLLTSASPWTSPAGSKTFLRSCELR